MATVSLSGPAAGIRGACPSVLDPFEALDGLLVRVRVPGGGLTSDGARTLARLARSFGRGPIELTRRANIQIRGVRPDGLPELQAELVAAGLVPASASEPRRGVLASPAAGLDPTEIADVRGLVAPVLEALASPRVGSVHPKVGVLLDGGGAISLRGRSQDLCFGAVTIDGACRFEVAIGASLPLDSPAAPVPVVPADEIAPLVADVLSACDTAGGTRRPGELGPVVLSLVGLVADLVPGHQLGRARPVTGPPLGPHPGRDGGTVFFGVMPLLGRVSPSTLERLSAAADDHGDGTMRLTPWRSVIIGGLPAAAVARCQADLASPDVVTDPADAGVGVIACAGSTGCASGHADTQADAMTLIGARRRRGQLRPPIHLSGCEKRCASRDPSYVTLIAQPGGYRVADA